MMRSAVGLSRLSLTEPSEMPAGGELTLATLGQSSYLVQGFNAGGTGWQVREVDYSQGGALSAQDALTKLYADIAAGAGPDLLLLEGMPVESLARRGYLADIGELLQGDPEVSGGRPGVRRQAGRRDLLCLRRLWYRHLRWPEVELRRSHRLDARRNTWRPSARWSPARR